MDLAVVQCCAPLGGPVKEADANSLGLPCAPAVCPALAAGMRDVFCRSQTDRENS